MTLASLLTLFIGVFVVGRLIWVSRPPRVYLAGAIQAASDCGQGWRDTLAVKIEKLGVTVLNPCKSEANLTGGTIEEAQEILHGWIASGHKQKFIEHMKLVRDSDLAMVADADFLVVYIDHSQRIGGTIHEIVLAHQLSIPVYVVCHDPLKAWNHWLLSLVLDNGDLFHSWDSLLAFLSEKYGRNS